MKKLDKNNFIMLLKATEPPIEECDKLVNIGLMAKKSKKYVWLDGELENMDITQLKKLYDKF